MNLERTGAPWIKNFIKINKLNSLEKQREEKT